MRQGEPQASLRAMRNDHTELWNTPKGRPQRRNTAQALAQGGAKVWDDHAELRKRTKAAASGGNRP